MKNLLITLYAVLPMVDITAGFAPSLDLDLTLFDGTLNTNVTTDSGLSDEMKTYYHDTLIDTAEPELKHDKFGMKAPIPSGRGKTIEFRYFDPLPKALTPLTEGVTPNGSKMTMHVLTATPGQFGDYVALSDVLMQTTLDPMLVQATVELGSQAGRSLDTITREVLAGGSNRMFAPSVSGSTITEILLRANITTDCKLTPAVIRAAVNRMKRMNVKKIAGSYAAIIHPDTVADLMGSTEWQEAQKYVNPDKIYKGAIGELYNAVFDETTEAKIIAPADIFTGVPRLTLKVALDNSTGSTDIMTGEAITVAQAAELTAKITAGTVKLYVGGKEITLASVTAGDPGTAKLVASAALKDVAAGAMICGQGAGKDGSAIYFTTLFGLNAYGITDISGLGLQHIVKQLGSAGTGDPLNQRSTVGWKATKCAERLIEAYMLRIEHSTSLGLSAESN